jgi:hypothetical protein
MVRSLISCLTLAVALPAVGCIEIPDLDLEAGKENGPCVDGQCLGGLTCVEGICLDTGATDGDDSTTGDDDELTTGSTGDDNPKPVTTSPATTTGDPTGSDTTAATTGDPTGDPTTGEPPPPAGTACDDDTDCDGEDVCYVSGVLGGMCGECVQDDDCADGGCTPPDVLGGTGAYCNDGSLGDGCQSSNACQDPLQCAVIFDLPGVATSATCSECVVDGDCAEYCEPDYDLAAFRGVKRCVPLAGLGLGEGCDDSAACASFVCAPIDVAGLFSIGACGECFSSADCPGACIEGSADLETGVITPSYCA